MAWRWEVPRAGGSAVPGAGEQGCPALPRAGAVAEPHP